jgi:hypothetical protein
MRAYISSNYHRAAFHCDVKAPGSLKFKPYPCGHNDSILIGASADAAFREARAILADTETTYPERFQCYDLRGRYEGPNSALVVEAAALAEALEAFIGEPCQCAGGIHWSAERGYYHCNGILPERS